MPKTKKEEQFPLLLFVIGNDQDLSTNNKGFRGRINNITAGATTVLTEWPNYIGSCWTTVIFSLITLLIMTMMLFTCMTSEYGRRLPRCVNSFQSDNKTVHLVHNSRELNSQQVILLETIVKQFADSKIHLIVVENHFDFESPIREIAPQPLISRNISNVGMILQRIVDSLARTMKMTNESNLEVEKSITLSDFLSKHVRIETKFTTYRKIFEPTPLFMNWMLLSEEVKLLAVRILQLWQFGGVSFDLTKPLLSNWYANEGWSKFKLVKSESVSVEDYGICMATKLPCHAFFGQLLMKLKRAGPHLTTVRLLKNTILEFCNNQIIDFDYCKRYKNLISQ